MSDDADGTVAPRGPLHPIGVVAKRTGITLHVLRAWERRYGVVEPERSGGGTRLYSTGDIAKLDEDGFVFITDRLARFSKIGGEMVPHVRIEDALHELAGAEQQTFAVTAIADEGRGERLAVLHVCDPCVVPGLLQKLAAAGFPPLFLPRAEHFVRVEALPFLGSGKLDLATLKRTARERIGAMP